MTIIPSYGIVNSQTVEGLFLELAILLQRLESLEEFNPSGKNLINVQVNTDSGVAQITCNMPIETKVSPFGSTVVIAKPYLADKELEQNLIRGE